MSFVLPVALIVVVVLAWLLWCSDQIHPFKSDQSNMIGLEGVAQQTFSQQGTVLVRGELWKAITTRGIIQQGDAVRVTGLQDGLTLMVEKKLG